MEVDGLMALAIDVASRGLEAGELPIGAVVLRDDAVIAQSFTQEKALGRRLVHAELLALTAADEVLGWQQRQGQTLTLVTNLEPCVSCA